MRVVKQAEARRVPWKNGRGWTTEYAVFPPDRAAWDARLSVAAVDEDGPFSAFPGVDRFILVVEGEGMDLFEGPRRVELAGRWASHRFDGGAPVLGRLRAGPVRDANWMVRRAAGAGFAALRVVGGALELEGEVVAALWLEGEGAAGGQALAPLDAVIGPGRLEGRGLAWVVGLVQAPESSAESSAESSPGMT